MHSHTLTHITYAMSWLLCSVPHGKTRSPELPSLPRDSILLHVAALTGTADILQMFACGTPRDNEPLPPRVFASTAGQWVIAKSTWLNTKGSGSSLVPHCPPLGRRRLLLGVPLPHPETKRTFT